MPAITHLVGIAKMASQSQLLEAKGRPDAPVEYFEIGARSILNRTKPNMPFEWTINPYRGCEFGCKYCYARYTHEFMGMENGQDFETRIYAKAAAPEILRRELRRIDRADRIAIGTATDPYQPAERRFRRTRAILEVFAAEQGRHLSITTKSDLVASDVNLLREIGRRNVLSVNITVTTLNRRLARLMEPRAPRPDLRLAAVHTLAEAGIAVGVFPNPILPMITDSDESLSALAAAARQAGAQYFGGGPLFLMPCAQKIFFPFLDQRFPKLAGPYRKLYAAGAYLGPGYNAELRERVSRIRERHGLASAPVEYRPELWEGEEQGTLFSLQ
jgi:DNA repair photolyase